MIGKTLRHFRIEAKLGRGSLGLCGAGSRVQSDHEPWPVGSRGGHCGARQGGCGQPPDWRLALGYSYTLTGRKDEARKIAAEFKKGGDIWNKQINLARIYTALGETDGAFRWLDAAYENRNPFTPFLKGPPWKPLHDDPRFHDLLHRMKLPPVDSDPTPLISATHDP